MKIEGNFSVKCECGKLHPFESEEADFDAVSSTEKANGVETGYKWNIDFDCSRCGRNILVDYDVFEYPKGKFDREKIFVGNREILEKFEISF